MTLRLIGAILIISGCGGFGCMLSAAHRKEVSCMRQLINALDYMECELQYRLTPLPDLCRQASAECHGILRKVFHYLTLEIEDRLSTDVDRCMLTALSKAKDIPKMTRDALELLGRSLGRFDMEGQLKGLEAVRGVCRSNLEILLKDQTVRLRSYQTLGLCAGAAIAILFI